MEPCLFRHGKARARLVGHGDKRASMEPCLFRHGKKAAKVAKVAGEASASMEPCLFRHGKLPLVGEMRSRASLQWSHVFSDMVRVFCPEGSAGRTPASMEPCLFRHGKPCQNAFRALSQRRLQWSHVFSDMVSTSLEKRERL